MKKNRVSFHHVGNYHIAIKPLLKLLGYEIVIPPPITKKTVELGFKYSPESVCIPFKYNIGNYIEAIEKGANVLAQAGGGCRFGFYAEVQEVILKNLGYDIEFLKLQNDYGLFAIIRRIKEMNPDIGSFDILKTIFIAYQKMKAIEDIEDYIRINIGFEKNKGELEKKYKIFLSKLDATDKISEIIRLKRFHIKDIIDTPIEKPDNPLKVAVVGEVYILMEPFSNFNLEKTLGVKGVEVYRFASISNIILHTLKIFHHKEKMLQEAKPYLKYHIGGHGTESVGMSHKVIKDGFNGIIHVKPFGCIPEINAMPALYKLSQDSKVPIIYFSFDSLTSETGINTRLDAFTDMLFMRRQKKYD